jgi:hypothetical protein
MGLASGSGLVILVYAAVWQPVAVISISAIGTYSCWPLVSMVALDEYRLILESVSGWLSASERVFALVDAEPRVIQHAAQPVRKA